MPAQSDQQRAPVRKHRLQKIIESSSYRAVKCTTINVTMNQGNGVQALDKFSHKHVESSSFHSTWETRLAIIRHIRTLHCKKQRSARKAIIAVLQKQISTVLLSHMTYHGCSHRFEFSSMSRAQGQPQPVTPALLSVPAPIASGRRQRCRLLTAGQGILHPHKSRHHCNSMVKSLNQDCSVLLLEVHLQHISHDAP
jgi:hypothetical protein